MHHFCLSRPSLSFLALAITLNLAAPERAHANSPNCSVPETFLTSEACETGENLHWCALGMGTAGAGLLAFLALRANRPIVNQRATAARIADLGKQLGVALGQVREITDETARLPQNVLRLEGEIHREYMNLPESVRRGITNAQQQHHETTAPYRRGHPDGPSGTTMYFQSGRWVQADFTRAGAIAAAAQNAPGLLEVEHSSMRGGFFARPSRQRGGALAFAAIGVEASALLLGYASLPSSIDYLARDHHACLANDARVSAAAENLQIASAPLDPSNYLRFSRGENEACAPTVPVYRLRAALALNPADRLRLDAAFPGFCSALAESASRRMEGPVSLTNSTCEAQDAGLTRLSLAQNITFSQRSGISPLRLEQNIDVKADGSTVLSARIFPSHGEGEGELEWNSFTAEWGPEGELKSVRSPNPVLNDTLRRYRRAPLLARFANLRSNLNQEQLALLAQNFVAIRPAYKVGDQVLAARELPNTETRTDGESAQSGPSSVIERVALSAQEVGERNSANRRNIWSQRLSNTDVLMLSLALQTHAAMTSLPAAVASCESAQTTR